jgi:hypothetical protein
MRLFPTAAVFVALLAACAPPPPDWSALPREEARANVPALLPGRTLLAVDRTPGPDLRSRAERFRFTGGQVVVTAVFAGSKLGPGTVQAHADRAAIEAWARSTHRQAGEVIAVEPVAHERHMGGGWLVTYRVQDSPARCTAGRSHLARAGASDDAGFIFDTAVSAVLCHPRDAPPDDLRAVFRRIEVADR